MHTRVQTLRPNLFRSQQHCKGQAASARVQVTCSGQNPWLLVVCKPGFGIKFSANYYALFRASLKQQVERSTIRPLSNLCYTHTHCTHTFVHIPVRTLRPNLFGFPQRNRAHLELGSVSQSIGNVLWLNPWPLPAIQVPPIPHCVVILAVLANTDGCCRLKLPTGHS